MTKSISVIVKSALFFGCLLLIIFGQKNVGYTGSVMMILGLAGLLGLLWAYNRDYQ